MLPIADATRRRLAMSLGLLGLLLGAPALAASQNSGRAPDPTQRVILITGSTSGLGREVARALAADGDHIIVHGRSEERGLALEIGGSGVTVNSLHPATFMDTNMIVGAGLQPRSSVMEGRDNVLLLINGESAGTGLFYVGGRPGRTLSAQPYDADVRAALHQVSERLIGR